MGAYLYLNANLVLVGLLLAGLAGSPAQSRPALLCGLFKAINVVLVPLFVPRYWNPVCTVSLCRVSPEDVIYLFALGGITWLLATWPVRRKLKLHIRPGKLLARYAAVEGISFVIMLGCWFSGLGPMMSHMVAMAAKGLVLLWRCGDLWMVAAAGAVGYTSLTVIGLPLACVLCPDFPSLWNPAGIWGPRLLGVPLEELPWAACAGAVTPFLMAYAFDAEITARARPGTGGAVVRPLSVV